MRNAAALLANLPGALRRAEAFGHLQPCLQAVFMEAIAHPGAGKPAALAALHLPEVFLGGDGRRVEQGMGVVDLVLHGAGSKIAVRIERHEQAGLGGQRLQVVHPIGQAQAILALSAAKIVPGGPQAPATRHEAGIAMQNGVIIGEAEGTQNIALDIAGVGQQRQRFVGMAGKDYLIEGAAAAIGKHDLGAVGVAHHFGNPGVEHCFKAIECCNTADILLTAALDGAPERPVVDLQQRVVGKKFDEGLGGKIQHALGGVDQMAAEIGRM